MHMISTTTPEIFNQTTTNNATTTQIKVVGGQGQTNPSLIYWILGVGIVVIGAILYATRNKEKEHEDPYTYHG